MTVHIAAYRDGFPIGYTSITRIGEDEDDTGIEFGVLRLDAGTVHEQTVEQESAWLLMAGSVDIRIGERRVSWERRSLFDESPCCIHAAADETLRVAAQSPTELTVYRVENDARFETEVYGPGEVANEHRGRGQVGDACYRFVRTIFDDTNSAPEAQLVLGEVITMPGRWSSYPPHHHPQPELYHYRFTEPQGYGHAELGDEVVKVRQYDTVKILAGKDHAQVAAPGYGMYYSWVIRHLPRRRYDVPEFTEDHRWTMSEEAPFWWPSDVPRPGDAP